MPDTRSKQLLPELQSYFDNIVKTLASKEDIESLKDIIKNQNDEISSLHEKVDSLEGEIIYLKTQSSLQERKHDDLEQYGRRQCLRISGITLSDNESAQECDEKVKSYIKDELKLDIKTDDYDRVHRIGKIRTENGTTSQIIIAKFKGFASRTAVYKARKKQDPVKIRFDLTKRRLNLYNSAFNKLKGHPKVKFVFVDVNCSLCIHLQDGSWKYFNTFEELESIAVKLGEFESIDALEEP